MLMAFTVVIVVRNGPQDFSDPKPDLFHDFLQDPQKGALSEYLEMGVENH